MELLKKYHPHSLKDIIGNRLQIKKIYDQLNQPKSDTYLLVICGPSGCGKTLICNTIFKELNFNVHEVTKDQTTTSKDLINGIKMFCTYKTIEDFIKPRRKVVFIDNIEVLLSQEKTFMSSFSDMLELLKSNQIYTVITCKIQEEKKLLEYKKDISIFKIGHPPVKDTLILILKILDEENYEYDDSEILDAVSKNRGAIRESLNYILNSNVSAEDLRVANMFKDLNGFEISKKLLHEPFSWKEIQELIKEDLGTISFLVYENVVDELHNNKDVKSGNTHLIKEYLKVVDNYVDSVYFEDYIHRNMDWSLYYLVNMQRLYGTVDIINKIPNKAVYKDLKYRYSQLLSKLSHRNILNKKVKTIYDNKFNTIDLLYLTDKVAKTAQSKSRSKKGVLSLEEQNLVNTYDKYFE